ncbi:MAG: hypothetical protein RLZZ546_3114 [Bacteroidota bacterium]|jgi:NADH-quinone oxidoreductase subunit N
MLQIIVLAGLGVLAMISEVLNFRKAMPFLTILGIVIAIAMGVIHWTDYKSWFSNMMADDAFSHATIFITSILFLLWLVLFRDVFREEKSISDYTALICFAMVGGFMMLSFSNLAMLFLGIEILSIPVYVLAGSNKRSLKSNESAFKYFIMGAFASGILLFGMTFVYGATGSFDLAAISQAYQNNSSELPVYFNLGILLIIFALSFKISAVPFHYWTPDVYEGAPTSITAFMSTLVKAFAVLGTFRLFDTIFGDISHTHVSGIAAMAALTMVVGNVLGAIQDNAKRTLAYSSIGHAGFMLLAILIGGRQGAQSLLYYVAAYSLASLLAFYVMKKVVREDDFYQSIGDFAGLFKRNSLLAIGMIIALLSMAGIPPLSGFFAKYFIFAACFKNGYAWLVFVAVISSLIGVYYYFKFIINMFKSNDDKSMIDISSFDRIVICIMIGLIIIVGLVPDSIIQLIG